MRLTKEEFIRRFRNHLAGVIATGRANVGKLYSAQKFSSVAEIGEVFNDLGTTSDATLAMFYDALDDKKPVPQNGAAQPLARK